MQYKLTVPTDKIRQRVRKARAELLADRQTVLGTMGVQLVSLANLAYRDKSRGGTGSDGIKWEPLAASTIKRKNRRGKANAKRKTTKSGKARPAGGRVAIGIDTGLQMSSVSPAVAKVGSPALQVTDRDVTVKYTRSYSKYFDEKRPLLPKTLPASWRVKCLGILTRWARSILDRVS